MKVYSLTDRGRVKSDNEDAYLVDVERAVFAIADGMGGHAAGEVASSMAIECIKAGIAGFETGDVVTHLRTLFLEANDRISEKAAAHPEMSGMGTTMVACVFRGNFFYIGNVGDSRAYLFRDGKLRQITKDQSRVQEMIDEGLLTPGEARTHPWRHVILQALGVMDTLRVDIYSEEYRAGDRFILSSDGLTDYFTNEEMEEIIGRLVSRGCGGAEIIETLTEMALERGGHDNITVLLVEPV